jgi:putative ABC transport system permease protein
MVEALKNMFRRKARTVLTIFGITIGIFAFVVMGSMAEKINLLVNGGTKYYADKVTVSAKGTSMVTLPTAMNISKAQEIARVKGVAQVSSTIYMMLEEDASAVSMGPPPGLVGTDFKEEGFETFKIDYSSGRALREGDLGKVVVGSDLVEKLHAKIGGQVTIRGKQFEVVGIMAKTLTAPDTSVSMALPDAQAIFYGTLPEIIRAQTVPEQVVNGFTVYVKSGVDPDVLAEKINREVADVKASGPQAFEDQVASATGILNAILFGIALISLIVGGLSIINTMTMSISERIREIGIKKAVGAKTRDIMKEYLTEAGMIGLVGGLIGLGLGSLTVVLVNGAMQASGTIIFLLTWRISLFAVGFSVLLGIMAGIYPAYYAVKVNIVKALREG